MQIDYIVASILVIAAVVYLMTKRWFWVASVGIIFISLFYGAAASLLSFQFLPFVGFSILSYVSLVSLVSIADY